MLRFTWMQLNVYSSNWRPFGLGLKMWTKHMINDSLSSGNGALSFGINMENVNLDVTKLECNMHFSDGLRDHSTKNSIELGVYKLSS